MNFLSDTPYPTPAIRKLHEQLLRQQVPAPCLRYEANVLDEPGEIRVYRLDGHAVEIDGNTFPHALLYETIVHVSIWGFDDRQRLEAEWSRLLDLATH